MSRDLKCQCIVSYKLSFSKGLQTENVPEGCLSSPVHFSFNHWFLPTGPSFQHAGSCDSLGWDSLVSVTNATDAKFMKNQNLLVLRSWLIFLAVGETIWIKKKKKKSKFLGILCCYSQAGFRFFLKRLFTWSELVLRKRTKTMQTVSNKWPKMWRKWQKPLWTMPFNV